VQISDLGKSTELKFGYNKLLLDEIKSMEGARWNPDKKIWTVMNSPRNHFAIRYLLGENVYERFEKPIEQVSVNRELFEHQHETVCFGMTRKRAVIGEEMGLGKTLAMIEIMEKHPEYIWWYVGTRSSIKSVELEFIKWTVKVKPQRLITYSSLRRLIEEWNPNSLTPHGIFFDESSRAKNAMAKQSQCAKHLAHSMIQEHGDDAMIFCMTGTPMPKDPTDLWHQIELVAPGYLKEGSAIKLKKRLALIVEKESPLTGGVYPHLVTWWDDPNKCKKCGELKTHPNHSSEAAAYGNKFCEFEPSKNEIEAFNRRLKGVMLIKFKAQCLDLPDMRFEIINLKPSDSILRAAKMIVNTAKSAMDAMIRLRTLSDGFQYKDVVDGVKDCNVCGGSGIGTYFDLPDDCAEGTINEYLEKHEDLNLIDNAKEIIILHKLFNEHYTIEEIMAEPDTFKLLASEKSLLKQYKGECKKCNKTGKIDNIVRSVVEVETPKEAALIELLENHEECGRIVIYAGFLGSIDRIIKICKAQGWEYIRFDGRGEEISFPLEGKEFLQHFQRIGTEGPDKLAFVAHPMSGGMGLTLTASPSIVYWSNDYNAESRMQSEARIHRPGMDINKGATCFDLIHLPTDLTVLDNLRKKKRLQSLALGELLKGMENADS
jgi:SNF2 family DNA or RNA helicase